MCCCVFLCRGVLLCFELNCVALRCVGLLLHCVVGVGCVVWCVVLCFVVLCCVFVLVCFVLVRVRVCCYGMAGSVTFWFDLL